jgi:DMSO reductase anchor subunit
VLGGKLFFAIGVLLILFACFKSLQPYSTHMLIASIIGITITTGIYSYWLFKKEKKEMLK